MNLSGETYSLRAAAYIRSLIRSGELSPGQPVREAFLVERLGMSRAPIREALFSLSQAGLICAEPQKGKYVRHMSEQEILDNYTVAGILEGAGVAESLPRWTEYEWNHLHEMAELLTQEANKATDLSTLADVDDLFHGALMSCCPNTRLVDVARSSCATISKYLYYRYWVKVFTPQKFLQRHLGLAEAIYSNDPEHIEKFVRAHYRETGVRMAQLIHDGPTLQG